MLNGWGFRRLVGGDYRNSYYEEHFLRNMPWLCKKMRRPKIGEKMDIPPEYEPDLKAISAEFPLPDHPISREIQVVLETIESGPKARMPFNWFVEEDLIRSSGSAKTPSKVDEEPISSLLGTVKKEDQIRASQPYLPVDPNEKNKPESQPALSPVASTLKVSPASENETLLFNYLRNAQKNNMVEPTGIVTQMHPAVALAQVRRNHCRTNPEFLAGVAAATQHHNATMRNFFGGAVHPHAVHNFATSQGDMGAHSLLQAMLGLDQGIRGHNGLGSALGSITAFQPQATRQRDMTSNMLLEAILSERNHSNASVGGAFLPLPPQAVHRRSPATMMQREVKANLLLRAIQKHQGIEGNHGAENATGFPSFQHQAVAHSVSPTDGNVNSSLPSQTLITGGNVRDTGVGLSHSSSGTMHYH
ncbi:hypothetical protein HJC23_010791 [Cyclotella cryptica]|uniref:Uncharacterized protein n=1 Tax=Cyclotella cryptica TaxID=29204 RepID=A0ABD3NER1_9STRA